MPKIQLGTDSYEYRVIRSKRKSLGIAVRKGEIIVRAPKIMSSNIIQDLMRKKGKWLCRSVKSMSKIADQPEPKKYYSGEIFSHLGNQYHLDVLKEKRRYVEFELKEDRFLLHLPLQDINSESIRRGVELWYRSQALQVFKERETFLTPLLNKMFDEIGYAKVKAKNIKIRQFRSRWGSCHADGTIVLNWRLIFAPLEIVDHVITHELIHLSIKNHSNEFWRVVRTMIPDYLEKEEWLRVNAPP